MNSKLMNLKKTITKHIMRKPKKEKGYGLPQQQEADEIKKKSNLKQKSPMTLQTKKKHGVQQKPNTGKGSSARENEHRDWQNNFGDGNQRKTTATK